jgi:hypothetical protein
MGSALIMCSGIAIGCEKPGGVMFGPREFNIGIHYNVCPWVCVEKSTWHVRGFVVAGVGRIGSRGLGDGVHSETSGRRTRQFHEFYTTFRKEDGP